MCFTTLKHKSFKLQLRIRTFSQNRNEIQKLIEESITISKNRTSKESVMLKITEGRLQDKRFLCYVKPVLDLQRPPNIPRLG